MSLQGEEGGAMTTGGVRRRRRLGTAWTRYLAVPGLGLAFVLAVYSLTQPWARARAIGVIGITRSPEAVLLVAIAIAGLVALGLGTLARTRRTAVAGIIHLALGVAMTGIAVGAFGMIRGAGVKLLFLSLASVRPGPGLWIFLAASILVVLIGAIEIGVTLRRSRPPGG